MVTKYVAGDAEIVRLVDNMDFYILPIFNVDGYEYTRSREYLVVILVVRMTDLRKTAQVDGQRWINEK